MLEISNKSKNISNTNDVWNIEYEYTIDRRLFYKRHKE